MNTRVFIRTLFQEFSKPFEWLLIEHAHSFASNCKLPLWKCGNGVEKHLRYNTEDQLKLLSWVFAGLTSTSLSWLPTSDKAVPIQTKGWPLFSVRHPGGHALHRSHLVRSAQLFQRGLWTVPSIQIQRRATSQGIWWLKINMQLPPSQTDSLITVERKNL